MVVHLRQGNLVSCSYGEETAERLSSCYFKSALDENHKLFCDLWIALMGLSESMIDLLIAIGIGALTAFLAILAGHVATEKWSYRWMFYLAGTFLAVLFVFAGVRQYKTAMAALKNSTPQKIVTDAVSKANEHSDQHSDHKLTELKATIEDKFDKLSDHSDKSLSAVGKELKDAENKQLAAQLAEIQDLNYNTRIARLLDVAPRVIDQMQSALDVWIADDNVERRRWPGGRYDPQYYKWRTDRSEQFARSMKPVMGSAKSIRDQLLVILSREVPDDEDRFSKAAQGQSQPIEDVRKNILELKGLVNNVAHLPPPVKPILP